MTVFATIPTSLRLGLIACVRLVSVALDVNMTNGLAERTPAEIRVSTFQYYTRTDFVAFPIGICRELSNTTVSCLCPSGWVGVDCGTRVNHCADVTCLNNGVCRSSLLNYTCQCLGESYSGRHCEVIASKTAIHSAVVRSLAYVAIIAMVAFAMFIVVMDMLKYCFGIDMASTDSLSMSATSKVTPHTRIRFVYMPSHNEGQAVSDA